MNAAARIDELRKRYDENPRRFFAPLANEYRKAGDLEQAIALCQQHLAEQPGNMNGHVVYGQALYESGRYDEAATTFETALTLDPENLIALRHLGDMSRTHGDNQKAREWYTRVLDADPRNEEIIGFLAEIDAAFIAAPVAPAARVSGAQEPAAKPEALAEAITQQVVARRPTPVAPPRVPAPVPAAHAADMDAIASMNTLQIGRVSTPVAAQSVTPPAPPPSLDLMDIQVDADTEAGEPPAPPFSEPAAAPTEPLADVNNFGDVTFGDPPAEEPAATLGAVEAAPVADGLGFDDLDFSMGAVSTAPAAQPADSEPREEVPEAAVAEHAPEAAAQPAFEEFLDLRAAGTPAVEAAHGRAEAEAAAGSDTLEAAVPEPEAEAVAQVGETPKAFVTETMAELYLRQGFRAEALAVYHQLVAENPHDAKLRERVRQLERTDRSTPTSGAAIPGASGKDAAVPGGGRDGAAGAGRTAREFFASLASRRALRRDGTPPSGTPAADAAAPAHDGAGAGARVSGGGTLDALFGNAEVAHDEEHLARAFARVAEAVDPAVAVKGKPTQPAQSELSLEHLFRDTPVRSSRAVPRQSEKLRFDQFFTPAEATPTEPATPPPAGEPGSPAELEQFQDWLQQLKKP